MLFLYKEYPINHTKQHLVDQALPCGFEVIKKMSASPAAYSIGGVVSRRTNRQGRQMVFYTSDSWFKRRIICLAAMRPVSCRLLSMEVSCG